VLFIEESNLSFNQFIVSTLWRKHFNWFLVCVCVCVWERERERLHVHGN